MASLHDKAARDLYRSSFWTMISSEASARSVQNSRSRGSPLPPSVPPRPVPLWRDRDDSEVDLHTLGETRELPERKDLLAVAFQTDLGGIDVKSGHDTESELLETFITPGAPFPDSPPQPEKRRSRCSTPERCRWPGSAPGPNNPPSACRTRPVNCISFRTWVGSRFRSLPIRLHDTNLIPCLSISLR